MPVEGHRRGEQPGSERKQSLMTIRWGAAARVVSQLVRDVGKVPAHERAVAEARELVICSRDHFCTRA